MNNNKTNKYLVIVSFTIMIIANILSVVLPINGITPAEVSDSLPNLFAPAGVTFLIWTPIYILLLLYSIYQLGVFSKNGSKEKLQLLQKINKYFTISSFANAAWIFSWHYMLFGISVILMLVILVCLIKITTEISKQRFLLKENIFIMLPFSIYAGWITVATIANVTSLLVNLGWQRFGLSEVFWTTLILIVGMLIAAAKTIKDKNIPYDLSVVWGYIGIVLKHTSATGFDSQFPLVIYTAVVSIIILLVVGVYVIFYNKKHN